MSTVATSGLVQPLNKYETVVKSGQATLNALMTMNGGATIAFLTFIGHLLEKGTIPSASVDVLVAALQLFIYGTFFAVLAYGTIFLTNCLSVVEWRRTSFAMFVLTVLCSAASLVCFLGASWTATEGFKAMTT